MNPKSNINGVGLKRKEKRKKRRIKMHARIWVLASFENVGAASKCQGWREGK
jgi:hypothetical protein